MSDDLVRRLRDVAEATGPNEARQVALDAAARIEELSNCVAVLEAKLSKSEALLAKAVEALERLVALNDDYSPFGGELLQDRVERTWQKARTTLAAVAEPHKLSSPTKGQNDE